MTPLVLVGRRSSHFTRLVRITAHELDVPLALRPVFDLGSEDPTDYAGSPALRVPILVDEDGPLFGSENICRALAARSERRSEVLLRGTVSTRPIANAEELVLHAMSVEVTLITAKNAGLAPPPKTRASLEGTLAHLDREIDAVLARLPPRRTSFLEIALHCLVEHLPWRGVLDVTPYAALHRFSSAFAARESARATPYAFDTA